jgi:O-6-methylguanine DNA methyltransferase
MESLLYQSIFESPIGPLRILSTPEGLAALSFGKRPTRRSGAWMERSFPGVKALPAGDRHRRVHRQIREYFEGRRRVFDIGFDLRGTEFQNRVWRTVARIPYGHTLSYGEIAHVVGEPRAARAVGAANGANPISIIIPCHRVIGADGSLTGYGGGMEKKRWLLAHEGVLRSGPVQMGLFRSRTRAAKSSMSG